MNPPISISVHTDNLRSCELRIAGRDGVAQVIKVPSDGNVYQGLHFVRHELERTINDILAANGVVPPEPPSVQPPPVDLGAMEADVAALEKQAADIHKRRELEERKADVTKHLEYLKDQGEDVTLPGGDTKPEEPAPES